MNRERDHRIADTTFVLAVQGLRLFGMIIAAPAVVRFLLRGR